MKDFDIWNKEPRPVLCIRNDKDVLGGCDGEMLVKDKVYHLYDVWVSGWYTEVYLEEFPDVGFNSVLFAEVE